jgi:hypothetical protein
MAVRPPSEPAGVRRACQSAFFPNIADSIGKPSARIALRAGNRTQLNKKFNLNIPNFISFSRRRRSPKSAEIPIRSWRCDLES